MVEHPVQYNLYAFSMQCPAYIGKILVGTKPCIDQVVVPGVISMGVRFEYR